MPVMAYLVGLLLLSERNVMARYGLILVGSSPGGSFSNFWTGRRPLELTLPVERTESGFLMLKYRVLNPTIFSNFLKVYI